MTRPGTLQKGASALLAVGLLCAIGFRVGAVLGQPEPAGILLQDRPAPSDGDTVDLVFEREVFSYPTFERRNPFRALTGEDDVGPRFEDLVLLGVISSTGGGGSVALLGTRSAGPSQQAASATYRVREGETLGNVRVIEIRPRQILVAVAEFGLTETRTLQLRRAETRPGLPPGDTAPGAAGEGPEVETPPQDVERQDQEGEGLLDNTGEALTDHEANGNGGWS